MRTCIKNGLCVLLTCLAVIMLSFPMMAAASSGHGGSTQVIARVVAPSELNSEEPSVQSSTPASQGEESYTSNGQPVDTGDTVPWLLSVVGVFSLIVILALKTESKTKTDQGGE